MIETVAILFLSDYFFRSRNHENTCEFLLKQLDSLGFTTEKVTFLHEDERFVTAELFTLSRQFDVVIVITKSLVDIVYKALRNITNDGFSERAMTNGDTHEASLLPSVAKVLTCQSTDLSIVYFHRIFVLQQENTERLFSDILKHHLEQYRVKPKFSKTFILDNDTNIDCVQQFDVSIQDDTGILKLTLEGSKFDEFVKLEEVMRDKINGISKICDNSYLLEIIYNNQERHIRQAIESIEKCFQTYGTENVFLSFNGGKDCTVLLHLIYTVLKVKYPEHNTPIFCMYVKSKKVFDEQEKFVSQCQIYYELEIEHLSSNMKEALKDVLSKRPNLKACFIGTRRTDPYSADLNVFQMTDPSWPKVMRVSPLLDWHYSDIWDYLLFYKIPYCKLYDMGYTSLGSVSNTTKNPGLSYYDAMHSRDEFLPAYKLLNESEERSGRDIK